MHLWPRHLGASALSPSLSIHLRASQMRGLNNHTTALGVFLEKDGRRTRKEENRLHARASHQKVIGGRGDAELKVALAETQTPESCCINRVYCTQDDFVGWASCATPTTVWAFSLLCGGEAWLHATPRWVGCSPHTHTVAANRREDRLLPRANLTVEKG